MSVIKDTEYSELLKQLTCLSSVCKRWYEVLRRKYFQRLVSLHHFTEINWQIEKLRSGKFFLNEEGQLKNLYHEYILHPNLFQVEDIRLTNKEHIKLKESSLVERNDQRYIIVRQYQTTEEFIDKCQLKTTRFTPNEKLRGVEHEQELILADPIKHLAQLLDDEMVIIPKVELDSNIFKLPQDEWNEWNLKVGRNIMTNEIL